MKTKSLQNYNNVFIFPIGNGSQNQICHFRARAIWFKLKLSVKSIKTNGQIKYNDVRDL